MYRKEKKQRNRTCIINPALSLLRLPYPRLKREPNLGFTATPNLGSDTTFVTPQASIVSHNDPKDRLTHNGSKGRRIKRLAMLPPSLRDKAKQTITKKGTYDNLHTLDKSHLPKSSTNDEILLTI